MTSRGGLLNHTTSVDVFRTTTEIQANLLRHHASKVLIEAADGEVTGVVFALRVGGQELGFRLPANVDACHKKLVAQWNEGKVQRQYTTREQAARVAWRIIKDWVEAQVALIETGMVAPEEIFLPYLITDGEHTVRDRLPEMLQRLLPAGRE